MVDGPLRRQPAGMEDDDNRLPMVTVIAAVLIMLLGGIAIAAV
jgi:hypothetical protein